MPPASGTTEDFTAVSVGTGYAEKTWNWNSRMEYRTATSEEKWNALTSYVAESKDGIGWSGRFQMEDTKDGSGTSKQAADLRFGGVYRPVNSKWILLDRLDFVYDRQRIGASTVQSSTLSTLGSAGNCNDDDRRVVNNFNANYKTHRNQVSLFYGAKYVLETIDNRNYSGYTDLIGAEWRWDVTKAWDFGLRGSLLHSWSVGQLTYSAGPSVGYNLIKNAWISLGYNLIGFTDKDFSAADYTAQGPFVRFRFKFDQNSVKDAANWLNHQ